jgi:Flp pilus assembly protein TadG
VSRRRLSSERGSITVELAILAPLIGTLMVAVVVVGRATIARADVEGAARSAARTISLAREPSAAVPEAREAAARTLQPGSPGCRSMALTPVITPEMVTVTVSCVVDLREGAILPLPGSMTVSGHASEVFDEHRERGP